MELRLAGHQSVPISGGSRGGVGGLTPHLDFFFFFENS